MAPKKKGTNSKKVQAAAPTPLRIPATPEEQAAIQARTVRARVEIAVLKQRFAETDVAKTIAETERDQLVQQLRSAQQIIERLTEELAEVKNSKDAASNEGAPPESEEG